MKGDVGTEEFHAWAPGLESSIPERLMPQATIYNPEHTKLGYKEARELSEFCGINPASLISFRLERLVQHELLVRVTADLSVADGPSYEELGINLRGMVAKLFDKHLSPAMPGLLTEFDQLSANTKGLLAHFLSDAFFSSMSGRSETLDKKSGWFSWFSISKNDSSRRPTGLRHDPLAAIKIWEDALAIEDDDLKSACLESLIWVVGSVTAFRGSLVTSDEMTIEIACNKVMNGYGATWVRKQIHELFDIGVRKEGYRYLPVQKKPIIMNVKGASASGKSTIRPKQRELAKKLGVPWEDFTLISPDYWRKYLLHYESLGNDYKYGAMLTGQELAIIDRKLDQYMAEKAIDQQIPHLLIDRFRFDSFSLEKDRDADSRLLTRFGDTVFMFFMVTPPSETVVRAWARGLTTGRYKAVDDLLYHNIEAYTGMPELFFAWAGSPDKEVHFEFLDNDVPLGELPKTIAFGWNRQITILDVEQLVNIERFKKVNVDASSPSEVFKSEEIAISDNLGFLIRCVKQMLSVRFADQSSGHVYAHVVNGELVWLDECYIEERGDETLQALFDELRESVDRLDGSQPEIDVADEKQFTFGSWLDG